MYYYPESERWSMSGARKSNTLFEAVPALGAISAHGTGRAKLMPVGFEHPGFELVVGRSSPGLFH